jgi:hypothetical protein
MEVDQPGGSLVATRIGSAEHADELLARQRGVRQRLAGSIKSALIQWERNPQPPSNRIDQFDFEERVLREALVALLRLPPPVERKLSMVDKEIAVATARALEEELEWSR